MAKKGKVTGDLETVDKVVRPERARKYKYLYLIICEDENTERRYFEGFKARIPEETIFLKAVGTGNDPLGVVKRAIEERSILEAFCRKEVDVIWVVFDKDDADSNAARIERFQTAFTIGAEQSFRFAFSNEAFELWLLLHLTEVDPEIPLTRQFIYQELQRLIRLHQGHETFFYEHGNASILEKIAVLGDEQLALQRAELLISTNGRKDPIAANPITYVGHLLTDLYEWIAFYAYNSSND